MNIDIKQATVKDIDACIRVQKNDGFAHQYYLDASRVSRLMDRETFFVASVNDTVVGFGSVDCEIRAQVHFICVDTAYKGQGIGRKLMHACLEMAKEKNCKRVCSYVEAGSVKEGFLTKMGFSQVGFYKDRYGNGVDASIWEQAIE